METSNLVDWTRGWKLETARLSESLVCSAHGGVQPVYSVHTRHGSQFQTEHSNVLRAWTVDIPRDAVQIGVQRVSRVKAGKVDKVCGRRRRGRDGGPRPRQLLITHDLHDHKRPRLAARAGMAKAAAKLWSASPAAVPEDFANIAYRFIQDWAATQPQCPRPGFPIKRRRSLPRASPSDHNPARPSVLVPTCHVDNHSMQEQWDAHAARRLQS